MDAPIVLQTQPGIVVETTSDDPDCKNSSLNDHMDVGGSAPAPGLYSASTCRASRDVFTRLLPVFISCVWPHKQKKSIFYPYRHADCLSDLNTDKYGRELRHIQAKSSSNVFDFIGCGQKRNGINISRENVLVNYNFLAHFRLIAWACSKMSWEYEVCWSGSTQQRVIMFVAMEATRSNWRFTSVPTSQFVIILACFPSKWQIILLKIVLCCFWWVSQTTSDHFICEVKCKFHNC